MQGDKKKNKSSSWSFLIRDQWRLGASKPGSSEDRKQKSLIQDSRAAEIAFKNEDASEGKHFKRSKELATSNSPLWDMLSRKRSAEKIKVFKRKIRDAKINKEHGKREAVKKKTKPNGEFPPKPALLTHLPISMMEKHCLHCHPHRKPWHSLSPTPQQGSLALPSNGNISIFKIQPSFLLLSAFLVQAWVSAITNLLISTVAITVIFHTAAQEKITDPRQSFHSSVSTPNGLLTSPRGRKSLQYF